MAAQTVVITGATGGLGSELVKKFYQHGFRVAAIGRNESKLAQLGEDLLSSQSNRAGEMEVQAQEFFYFCSELGCSTSVERTFNLIHEKFGAIDILFNCAAVYQKVNFLEETSSEWEKAIASSLNSVAFCCKAALPKMVDRDRGVIFNVGSWADLGPIARSAAYSASKGAVRPLTKAIAADLIEINSSVEIHEWIPGHLRTKMSDFTGIDPAVSAEWGFTLACNPRRTKSSIYENDHEWFPPKGLKQKLRSFVLRNKA